MSRAMPSSRARSCTPHLQCSKVSLVVKLHCGITVFYICDEAGTQ